MDTIYRVYTLTDCVWIGGEPTNKSPKIYDGAGVVAKDHDGNALQCINTWLKQDGKPYRLKSATVNSRPLSGVDSELMMNSIPA